MTALRITHDTLVANTIKTVTFTYRYEQVEVLNRDGTATIYFTTDGSAPTVAGDDVEVVPPNSALTVDVGRQSGGSASQNTTVKLISSGAPAFTVTGSDES